MDKFRLNVGTWFQTLVKILALPILPLPSIKLLLKVVVVTLGIETNIGGIIPLMMETQ
jgi:hypothetical protein